MRHAHAASRPFARIPCARPAVHMPVGLPSRLTDGAPMTADQSARGTAADLVARLGVAVDDLSLVEQALCHRSWTFEHPGTADNERLEFLGDAVLGLVVTDRIYRAHPEAREGRLAKVRAAAVKTASLADIAREHQLGAYVRLGRGEMNSGGANKDSILADTLEALLGAVYLTCGFAVARELVERLFGPRLAALADVDAALDYKTSLQELAAAQFGEVPRYSVSMMDPTTTRLSPRRWPSTVNRLAAGIGPNKKAAEQLAAREAYRRLRAVVDGASAVDG
jgi:ribonuclease III